MVEEINLNKYEIQNDIGPSWSQPPVDNSMQDIEATVSVFFRNQKQELIDTMSRYRLVVGCVAWLTDFDILKGLSKVENVAIVVQKEDFLRPDLHSKSVWKSSLRNAYSRLKCDLNRYDINGLSHLSVACDPTIEPVRCVGNHNSDKKPAFPRMHNKFLVFCDVIDGTQAINIGDVWIQPVIRPEAVWTGSFNLTYNATCSLENSILIENSYIPSAYFNEFCQIFSISEQLNWTSKWCEPELRIGS